MSQDRPLVSVIVLTYRHEPYLATTLDSILMQELDAQLEVLVMEDHSPDGSRAIAERYVARYPDKVRLYARERNMGGKQNLIDGFRHAKGDFVTVIDGDDYWTDPQKLALQIALLQANPDYAAASHNTLVHYEQGDKPDYEIVPQKRKRSVYYFRDLILGKIYLHTSSLLYRNFFKDGLPAAQHDVRVGDTHLCMLFAERGPIGFIDRSMSVYRYTHKGIWSSLNALSQRMATLESLVVGNEKFDYRYAPLFDRSLARYSASLIKEILIRAPWRTRLLFRASLLFLGHLPGMLVHSSLTRAFATRMDRFVLTTSDTPQERKPEQLL